MPALCIIPARALEDERLTATDLRALLAIGKHTSARGGNVYAKRDTLAEVARLDPANYRRAVRKLVDLGYVRRVSRFKPDGSPWTNLISIILDEPVPTDVALVVETEGADSTPSPTDEVGDRGEEGAKSTPTPSGRVSPPPVGADSAPREGAESAPKTNKPLNVPASPPPAIALLADRFAHAPHREAYLTLRRAHRMPAAFDAALEHELHQPIAGGAGYAWDVIGAALLQSQGNGESFNVSRLRGYCRRHLEGPPASGRVGARASTGEMGVRLGGAIFGASLVWQLCVDVGLTSPMQSRETVLEAIEKLVARGLVGDAEEFLSLVTAVDPPALAEIKFAKTREERLRERLTAWAAQAPGRAA